MVQSICILGRQPALGLAELESLYGSDLVSPVGTHAAGVDLPARDIDFARLGSITRLANVLGEVPSTNWKMVEKALTSLARSSALNLPASGKFHLGLSAIGFDVSPAKLGATGLTLKKVIRSRYEGSVRLAPNVTAELSTAQVFHNNLTDANGCELLIIAQGNTTIVARTITVQDIDSYTLRDRGRPRRDARVGMLPPKLAQLIVNLATGPADISEVTVLDPFCGTGVILQEAMLMGYRTYGSDLEPRMINYSEANLAWFTETYELPSNSAYKVEPGDATDHHWDIPQVAVATETYLGRPFTGRPAPDILAQTVVEVNLILKRFLQNLHPQLKTGSRLCLAVPAWFINDEIKHPPIIASLEKLGFKRITFTHADATELIYHREEQIVGRELLVLESV